MFGDGPLTFREAMMREPLPLATIHDAILFEFLRGRDDAVLFGAQAVNAYVEESRLTQDVDIASPRAEALAEELMDFLNKRFHIAVRMRSVRGGIGYRICQVQKPKNRHLVDLRPIDVLPPCQRVENVLVVTPPELIAGKVMAWTQRQGKPKAGTDWRDLAMLYCRYWTSAYASFGCSPGRLLCLNHNRRNSTGGGIVLTFPELKTAEGPVAERLRAAGASDEVLAAWRELVARKIEPEDEDAGY